MIKTHYLVKTRVIIVCWLIFHTHGISNSIVVGEGGGGGRGKDPSLSGSTLLNHTSYIPHSSSTLLHSGGMYEKTHETGFSELDAQKKSRESKSPGRKDLISGELLVSIPLKVILSSLKDNPFRTLQRRHSKQGSRKSSFSSPPSPLLQTSSSIDDILSSIGLDSLSPTCKIKFVCSILSRAVKYRPLSDILFLLLTSERTEKDTDYKHIIYNKSGTCTYAPMDSSCGESPRINLGALKLWQRLSKYYDLNITTP